MVKRVLDTKNTEELYAEVAQLQVEVDKKLFGGISDTADEEYLELIKERFALAELKQELALRELSESSIDEYEKAIEKKLIELDFEKEQNYYQEGGYRWALANVEKASPNSMMFLVPEGVITSLKAKLLPMGIVLTAKEESAHNKQIIKDLMLQRSKRIVEIKKEEEALQMEKMYYESSAKKMR